jgi:hypothetical protein
MGGEWGSGGGVASPPLQLLPASAHTPLHEGVCRPPSRRPCGSPRAPPPPPRPLVPVCRRAYPELERTFESAIIGEAGQGLLTSPEAWAPVLAMVPNYEAVGGPNLQEVVRVSGSAVGEGRGG